MLGTWTQGGSRLAPLPWATVFMPLGAENLGATGAEIGTANTNRQPPEGAATAVVVPSFPLC